MAAVTTPSDVAIDGAGSHARQVSWHDLPDDGPPRFLLLRHLRC